MRTARFVLGGRGSRGAGGEISWNDSTEKSPVVNGIPHVSVDKESLSL